MTCPPNQGFLVFQDSATIPCVLLPIRQQMLSLTRILLFVSLPIGILLFWLKLRGGERVFGDLLRFLVIIVGIAGYDQWFEEGVTIVGALAQSLYPSSLVLAFYERVWQSNLIPGSVGSFVSFLSDPMGLLYLALLDGLKVIVLAFTLVRYALLAFLYIVGPIIFSVAVIPGFFFLVGQWARNTLEISLWLLFHNLLIGIFSSINLYQALSSGPVKITLINRVLEIGILLVLVLMILFVPILTHLLLDRSYEGIGSFVGPQAEALGRNLWQNVVSKPLLKGELPFGVGEFKAGTTTKDLGQGRRVYRKKQLRIGPLDFTSMIWQRIPKKKSPLEGKTEESDPKGTKKPRATASSSSEKSDVVSKSSSRVARKRSASKDKKSAPRARKPRSTGKEKAEQDDQGEKM